MARADRFSLKPLPEGEAIIINKPLFVGTESDSDLVLQPGYGSRRHALIKPAGDTVTLEDLGSRNGTFINDKKLPRGVETRLSSGDKVRFARQKFEFRDAGPELTPWIDDKKLEEGGSATQPIDDASGKRIENGEHLPGKSDPVDQPCLEVISGTRTGERIAFRNTSSGRAEWKIGSKAELGAGKEPNFVVLADEGVSEEHARITCEGSRWAVDDLVSKNGTFVNGRRMLRSYLASGDQIAFGPVVCIFKLPGFKFKLPGYKARRSHDETQTDIPALQLSRWAALTAWLRRLFGGRPSSGS